MSYILIIGRQEEGHFSDADKDIIKYRGRHDALHDLDIPSIEIAHQIAKLCNIKSYAIASSSWNWTDNIVFETPDITAWDKAKDDERKKDERAKTENCARINKLPTSYTYGTIAEYIITFRRSKAEYNPRRNEKVEWGLSINMHCEKKDISLYTDNYYSKGYGTHRKRLHARFERDFNYYIKDQAQRDKLWDELPKIEARYNELKQQIENA